MYSDLETKYVPKMTEITTWNMAGEMLLNFMKKEGLHNLIPKTKIDASMFEQWEQSIRSVDYRYFDFYEKIKIWEYEKQIFKEMGYFTSPNPETKKGRIDNQIWCEILVVVWVCGKR